MRITFVRLKQVRGFYGGMTLYTKGTFQKEFKDLDEVANFVADRLWISLAFGNAKNELTPREWRVLTSKITAIRRAKCS